MIKRMLILIFVALVVIVAVNDIGRYVSGYFKLSDTTQQATLAAARAGNDRNTAAAAAMDYTSEKGITVYAFDMDGSRVYVYTEMPLSGTWVLSPLLISLRGGRLADDYMLRAEHNAVRQ